MDKLPEKFVFNVYRLLTPRDLINSALTCKVWRKYYSVYKYLHRQYQVSRYYYVSSSNRSLCQRYPIGNQLRHMAYDVTRDTELVEHMDIVIDMSRHGYHKHHRTLFFTLTKVFRALKKSNLQSLHVNRLSLNLMPNRSENKQISNVLISLLRCQLHHVVSCSLRDANLTTDSADKLLEVFTFCSNVYTGQLGQPALTLTCLDIVNVVHVDLTTIRHDATHIQEQLSIILPRLINLRQLHIMLMWLTPELLKGLLNECHHLIYLEVHMNGATTQCDVSAGDWLEVMSQHSERCLQVHVTVIDVCDVEAMMGVMIEHMPVATFRMINKPTVHAHRLDNLITHLATTYYRTLMDLYLDANSHCDDLDNTIINLVTLCRCKVHLKQLQLRPETLAWAQDTVDVSTN